MAHKRQYIHSEGHALTFRFIGEILLSPLCFQNSCSFGAQTSRDAIKHVKNV